MPRSTLSRLAVWAALLYAGVPVVVRAQSGDAPKYDPFTIGVQSPTAASIANMASADVGLETGAARVSIPLFTLSDPGGIEIPIVLEYRSNGVKVDESPGWVGVGWALRAGGTITRSVMGQPDDEQGVGYPFTAYHLDQASVWNNLNYYINGTNIPPGDLSSFIEGVQSGSIDTQPDVFYFSFNGRSGQLFIPPNGPGPLGLGSVPRPVRTIPHTPLRFELEPEKKWKVTDDAGVVYRFDRVERTLSVDTDSDFQGTARQYISSWLLTTITSPTSGTSATFEYDDPYLAPSGPISTLQRKHEERMFTRSMHNCTEGNRVALYNNRADVWEPVLQRVVLGDQEVRFYSSRYEMEEAYTTVGTTRKAILPKLDKVELWKGGVLDRTFELTYTLAPSFPSPNGAVTTRAFLSGVAEKGSGGEPVPPYAFAYHPGQLPSRLSFAQDHWGYYNGAVSNTTLLPDHVQYGVLASGANREPEPAQSMRGVLTSVTYPTGGREEFAYEGNERTPGLSGGNIVVLGDEKLWTVSASSNNGGPPSESRTFVVGGILGPMQEQPFVRFDYSVNPAGGDGFAQHLVDINCGSGNTRIDNRPGTVGFYVAPNTTCTMLALADPVEGTGRTAHIIATWQEWVAVPPSGEQSGTPTGGVRVRSRRTYPGGGAAPIVQRYVYRRANGQGEPGAGESSGFAQQPVYATPFVMNNNCEGTALYATSQVVLGGGSGTTYDEVAVVGGGAGEAGQTVHRYVPLQARPTGQGDGTFPGAETNHDWRFGQLSAVLRYAASGNLLKETRHTYSDEWDQHFAQYRALALRAITLTPGGVWRPRTGITSWPGVGFYRQYDVVTGWNRLMRTADTVY